MPSWAVVAVYLAAGLAASVAVLTVVAAFETDGTLMGSSAAVFGVAAAVLAMRPSAHVLGGRATQWLAVLVGINVVFVLTQPTGSVAHLTGLAVGVACGRWVARIEHRQGQDLPGFARPHTTRPEASARHADQRVMR